MSSQNSGDSVNDSDLGAVGYCSDNEEVDITPFKRESALFPGESFVYFVLMIGLLIGAHLQLVSIWWLFGLMTVSIVPSEVKKIRKYGIWAYLDALHFKRLTLKQVGVIIGGLIVIFGVLMALISIIFTVVQPTTSTSSGGHLLGQAKMSWWLLLGGVLMMFLVVGPIEELIFRHRMQGWFKKHLEIVPTIIVTNAIFASLHIPMLSFTPNLILFVSPLIGVFILGCIFSMQYEYTDNLAVPSLTHSTYNSLILTVVYISQHLLVHTGG